MPEFTVTVYWTSEQTGARRRSRLRVSAEGYDEARQAASLLAVGHENAKTGGVVKHRQQLGAPGRPDWA